MSNVKMANLDVNDEIRDDDDELQLSVSTLAALNEFLSEKKEREEKLRLIAEEAEKNDKVLDDVVLEEDWVSKFTEISLRSCIHITKFFECLATKSVLVR